ncbi:MAG: hypothetical protein QXD04_04710 [Candidatus Bathyarchaeia archaeon]
MKRMNKNIVPVILLHLLYSMIIGGIVKAVEIEAWQSETRTVCFGPAPFDPHYGPYIYYPLSLYVRLDGTNPSGRQMDVRIRYEGFDQTWRISEGQSTPSVYPGGKMTWVDIYMVGDTQYYSTFTIYYYDG